MFAMSDSIDYYNQNALIYFERTVVIDMSDLYEPFLRCLPKGAHILDAGCGAGRDTKHFTNLGYNVTAIDASQAMVSISSKFTDQKTLLMTFQDLSFVNCFDGIWASASLLHVPRQEMSLVFKRFIAAIKDGGTWYLSFKVGDGERVQKDGRFFNDYNEDTFRNFLSSYKQILDIITINSTITNKDNCLPEKWLNILLRVDKSN
jgi:SAM-dependent methyltransferase